MRRCSADRSAAKAIWFLRRVAYVALLWYLALALLCIKTKPGLYYDEAIDVLAAVHLRHSSVEMPLPHPVHTWVRVRGRSLPLMSAEYIGSIKDYICLPLFAVFGPSAELIRLVTMAMGALGILGITVLLGRAVSYPVAAAVAWGIALNPSYLAVTVFDNPGFAPCMAALGLLCLTLSGYLRKATVPGAFWIGWAMGFGVWARANYLWFLAALMVGIVAANWRILLAPWRHWMAWIAGGVVGGLPFLVYQAISRGGTLATADTMAEQGSLTGQLAHRLAMLAETLLSDGEHRVMWSSAALPAWQLWVFPAIVGVSCLLCFKSRGPRIASITFLVLMGLLLLSGLPVAEHHLVILVPIAVVVVAMAGWDRRAALAIGLLYAGCAVYWQASAVAGLRRTGGIGPWSDGIFALTKRLESDFAGREVKVLDWGLQNSVYVLSDGRAKTREIFWDATEEKTYWNGTWADEIRKGGVYLLNGPENRQIPAASIGFLRALAKTEATVRRYSIPQRSGAVFAEVIEIIPISRVYPMP